MSVGRAEVERIAALARLRLDGAEVERLADEMTRILAYVERMRASVPVDPDGADASSGSPRSTEPLPESGPGAHVGADADDVGARNRGNGLVGGIRAPGHEPDALEIEATRMAPSASDGFFLVPPLPGVNAASGAGTGEPDDDA